MSNDRLLGDEHEDDPPDPAMDAVTEWFAARPPMNFAAWEREGGVIKVELAWEFRAFAAALRDEFGTMVTVEIAPEGTHIELQSE